MSLLRQVQEVLASRTILKLFDVRIIDLEPKLTKLGLNVSNHMITKDLAFLEQLFHSHRGDDTACFALYDSLDYILHMASTRSDCYSASASLRVVFTREEYGVLHDGFEIVFWTDGENSGQREFELFDGHGL